jgi:protocatechuate 3,4-dioxygenase beta subunit
MLEYVYTGGVKPSSRRSFLKGSAIAGAASLAAGAAQAKTYQPTPIQTEGPFYPITPQKDKDFDLTHVAGREGRAQGDVIKVSGRVLDTKGSPIEDATVDIWQANTYGRYHHPHDKSDKEIDPDFQGWAIVQSGVKGEFNFTTIKPGPYAVSKNWSRTPHIHFKVSKRGYLELTTQMYFPGEPLNEKDRILQHHSAEEQERLIAAKTDGQPPLYDFTIVLAEV